MFINNTVKKREDNNGPFLGMVHKLRHLNNPPVGWQIYEQKVENAARAYLICQSVLNVENNRF